MSFSSNIKEDLNKMWNNSKDALKSELIGYYLSSNMVQKENNFEFITESEFSIEHFYKILFELGIHYEPEIKGKSYIAEIRKEDIFENIKNYEKINGDLIKSIAKGAFLGAGSVNNPDKNYHLEIILRSEEAVQFLVKSCKDFNVNFKEIKVNDKYQIYLKEGEEISKFLALIGANKAVLKFEEVRVMKDIKNNVNRKVNCETANLNKTIEAALKQIDDINFIKKCGKFDRIPSDLQEIAILRLENPDLSLLDLGKLLEPQIGKSAVNRKFKKIHEIAEELR